MAVKFVNCPPGEVGSVRAFFADMYRPDYILSADEGFLKWQFGPTVFGDAEDLNLILGLVDGAIKGCIGYIPVEVSVAGSTILGAWAANWMIDQSTRRLGLGPLLMRELSNRFPITLALGGNSDAHDLLPRMGWRDLGCLDRYVYVVDPVAAATLTENGGLEWPAVPPPPVSNGASRQVERFNQEATALWDRVWGDNAIGTRRTDAFLNWRYASHPIFTHHLFELRHSGTLEGIAVTRMEQVRGANAKVVRVLELIGDEPATRELVGSIIADAKRCDAAVVDFFCSSRRMMGTLEAAGFLKADVPPASDIPILFQPIDHERTGILLMAYLKKAESLGTVADWYVTKSDGDQDRPC